MPDTTALNQQYFDKEASTYDTRHEKTLDKIVEDIRSHLNFISDDWASDDDDDSDEKQGQKTTKRSVRLLDYACGTGTISRALAPYTTQCVGIDLAPGMVAAYNRALKIRVYPGPKCLPLKETSVLLTSQHHQPLLVLSTTTSTLQPSASAFTTLMTRI